MRLSTEDSIGVPLFRTDLEKVVRPGVKMPAEDIISVSPNAQRDRTEPLKARISEQEAGVSVLGWIAAIG